MTRTHSPTISIAMGIALVFSLTGIARAQGRSDTVVLSGTVLPGTGNGTFGGVGGSGLALIDGGQVAFFANVNGGTTTGGVFRYSGAGTLSAVAVRGQAAPGAGAATFTNFGNPNLSATGQLSFVSIMSGGTSTSGMYRSDGASTLTAVALQSQAAPGAGAGTFSGSFSNPPLVNYSGQLAFVGGISGGTSTTGLYRGDSYANLTPLALAGQAAPGTGGTFSTFSLSNTAPSFNDAGQVVVLAGVSNGTSSGGIYRASTSGVTPLYLAGQSAPGAGGGTFGGSFNGSTMNGSGQVAVVAALTAAVTKGVFRSDSGTALTALALTGQAAPSPGGGLFSDFSGPISINASGQTAFGASIAGGTTTAGIYRSNGTGTALTAIAVSGQAAPGTGSGTFAIGFFSPQALADSGALAFQSSLTGGTSTQGVFVGDGRDLLAVQLQGATLAGKTVSSASLSTRQAINAQGQIAYAATFTDGTSGLFIYTPSLRWRDAASGSWDNSSSWTLGLTPAGVHDVTLDPTVSVTVTGPAANTDIRRLNIGGDGTVNNGIATLYLNGGTLNVLGSAGKFTTITANGVLTGDGTINGAVVNQGTVNAVNLSLPGGLTNSGIVTGNGRLNANLSNAVAGAVQLGSGQRLILSGTTHTNAGVFDLTSGAQLQVIGGFTNNASGQVSVAAATARFDGAVTNSAGGRFQLNDATVRFNGGLTNSGQVQVTFGESSVFGAVTTNSGGKVILSGNSNTTFYDAIDVKSGGELRISTGSTAVFFGQVFQRTGALFTGTGSKFYEGGLTIGGSPGLALDSGDVSLGAGNLFIIDIGGTTACTAECATNDALRNSSFDKYIVAGKLSLGGTLKLGSWNGYTLQAGQTFDLLDWGSVGGGFDSIDTSGLLLASGTALDTSQLAIDGSFSVVAVPEPGSWALMLTGLTAAAGRAGWTRRRRDAGVA